MVFRILESEDYFDRQLYHFMLGGSKNPDYTEELNINQWLNTRVWGDLK